METKRVNKSNWVRTVALLAAIALLLSACSSSSKPKTLDKIPDKLDKAMEAYGWFELSTLPVSKESVKLNGKTYNKVTDKRFASYTEFENYILSIFSSIVGNTLLGNGLYAGVNNQLYCVSAARGSNALIGKVTYTETKESNTKIVYTATVKYMKSPGSKTVDHTKTYNFVLEKDEGKWLFTTFDYFY